jgi:hypothetical protein
MTERNNVSGQRGFFPVGVARLPGAKEEVTESYSDSDQSDEWIEKKESNERVERQESSGESEDDQRQNSPATVEHTTQPEDPKQDSSDKK